VQVPAATTITVAPLAVQTGVVSDAKLTGRPDVALAETMNGGDPIARLTNGANAIVCAINVTLKLWLMLGAAA
jgi:hypothetical protein